MLNKYIDKLFLKQWVLGVARCNSQELIREKKKNISYKWFEPNTKNRFFADPFIFITGDDQVNILYEDLTKEEGYGKLVLMVLDKSLNLVTQKTLLDTELHMSYPFICKENDKIYIFPETSKHSGLSCFEFDQERKELVNKREICDFHIIDPTILHHNDKYWLFGTLPGNESNTALHIFNSDSLFGPYKAHRLNPVRTCPDGVRSAGSFIVVDDTIYRPAQICTNSYGESIAINKLCVLNENEYVEENYMNFDTNDELNAYFGVHTINSDGGFLVIDVLKRHFQPIQQIIGWVKKQISKAAVFGNYAKFILLLLQFIFISDSSFIEFDLV